MDDNDDNDKERYMSLAVVDREDLEASLALLEALQAPDANVRAAAARLKHALAESTPHDLLTTTQAAAALGVRSVNTVKYWCKSGYIHGVKRNERILIPLSEIERIKDDDRVRMIRAADRLHDETEGFGPEGLTQEDMDSLSASRPGTLPWQR